MREKAQLKFNPILLYPFDGRASNAGGEGLSSTHPLQPLVRCAVYVRNVYIHIYYICIVPIACDGRLRIYIYLVSIYTNIICVYI